MNDVVLYDYWRSSAACRVRIALNLKGIGYRAEKVDLLAAEHRGRAHLARNPQGLVPALAIDGLMLSQSLAIIDYLDETRPAPALLPATPADRARVRVIAQAIAMEIHPICNTSVTNHVVELTGSGEDGRRAWMDHFIGKGLAAVETLLDDPHTGRFCHGDTPGLADCCLMPQLYNARRWGVELTGLERIAAIERRLCRDRGHSLLPIPTGWPTSQTHSQKKPPGGACQVCRPPGLAFAVGRPQL